MYLVPQSEIKIGNMRFFGGNTGINAVEIDTSVKKLVSTAKITLPANFKNSEGIVEAQELQHGVDDVMVSVHLLLANLHTVGIQALWRCVFPLIPCRKGSGGRVSRRLCCRASYVWC